MPSIRKSIFKKVTKGGVRGSSVENIITQITKSEHTGAEYNLKSAKDKTQKLWDVDPDKRAEVYEAFSEFLNPTDNIQSERDEHFYDQYVKVDNLPAAIACNSIYGFVSNAFDTLQKDFKNFSKLGAILRIRDFNQLFTSKIFSPFRDFFEENTDYSNNLQSFLNDVHVLKEVFDKLDDVLYGSGAPYNEYNVNYYSGLIYKNPYFNIKNLTAQAKANPDKSSKDYDPNLSRTDDLSAFSSVCKLQSFVSKSIEAFNELGHKLDTLRAKFNKFFKQVLELEEKFEHAKAANSGNDFNKQKFCNKSQNLTPDSAETQVGKRFHKQSVTLASKSSSHDVGSADPEQNEYLRFFEIGKGVHKELASGTLKLLQDDNFANTTIPTFFANVRSLETQDCVPLHNKIDGEPAATFLIRMRTFYNCLRTVTNSEHYKDLLVDDFEFDDFKKNCKLNEFKNALAILEKEKVFSWKYVKGDNDSTKEQNSISVTINDSVGLDNNFDVFKSQLTDEAASGAVEQINNFMKDLDKYYLVDTAIIADGTGASCVKNGVLKKGDRKLPDTSEGRAQGAKNLLKSARNKLVRDIKFWSVADVIKNKGKLPETASRTAFPEFDKYDFVLVNSDGRIMASANAGKNTVSHGRDITKAKTIAEQIYHMAVMSKAYGKWTPGTPANWGQYQEDMKHRYILKAK